MVENPRDWEFVAVYRLKALIGLNAENLKRHLTILTEHGLVKEVDRQGKYALERTPAVEALIHLLKTFIE